MMLLTADEIRRLLALQPHPEGGAYREFFRSTSRAGDRSVGTSIYYLLPAGERSCLHRIRSDEIWHHQLGGALVVVELTADGVRETRVGPDIAQGDVLHHVVPAGNWFGAYPAEGTEFSLAACTVMPGFEFDDFEMGQRENLLAEFPHAKEMIERLTHDGE